MWGFSLVWNLNFEIWGIFFKGFYHVTRTLLPSVTLETMGSMQTEIALSNKRQYTACDHCPCKNDTARSGKNEYRGCPAACHHSTVSQKSTVPFYVPCSTARFLLLFICLCIFYPFGAICMCVSAPIETRKGGGICRSCNYRWAAQHGCWALNSGFM